MTKQYKLLKDTPESKAGIIFEYREEKEYKRSDIIATITPSGYYPQGYEFKGAPCAEYYSPQVVEFSPEWFMEVSSSQYYITADNMTVKDGDKIYGIAIQASGADRWREQRLPFKTPVNENRAWFGSKEAANKYLIENSKLFSIDELCTYLRLTDFDKLLLSEIAKELI